MGRWEPNARGRLAEAALKLYAEQGFERTTVAEIAEATGLTERTFFRHFADKREVLFYGTEMALDLLTRTIAEAPPSALPMDAVTAALDAFSAFFQEDPARVRSRHALVSASTELRERELVKLDAFAAGMAGALRERGTPQPAADLAAEAGLAAFKVAYGRWVVAEPGAKDEQDLPGLLRTTLAELQEILAHRAPA
ncbi:TetR/AcrR family transcriptional regulator [Streptomyces sp. cg35]|uniref:TetR/AcrR family transcriptional regulator n=1 Tax=Streptomyces sp. cg35 TaxID=3421650 RepID=UPI003D169BB2